MARSQAKSCLDALQEGLVINGDAFRPLRATFMSRLHLQALAHGSSLPCTEFIDTMAPVRQSAIHTQG